MNLKSLILIGVALAAVTVAAKSQQDQVSVFLTGANGRQPRLAAAGREDPVLRRQCAIRIGTVVAARTWRVAPPRIISRRRLCP